MRRLPNNRTRPDRKVALGLGIAMLGSAYLGACSEPDPLAEAPNVVLIVLDTVRADHLSCYGYDRLTTPHIDALCDSAVRYTHCRATGPWTLPSHASMFTGRFPYQHRARTEAEPDGGLQELPLSFEHWTLAESLASTGYRTGAFVANAAYLREEFQLDQGFEHYVVEREPALEKNKAAFEWMDDGEGPFFLFLNFMDAHRPYNTRPIDEERAQAFAPDGVVHSATLLDQLYAEVMGQGREGSADIVEELVARYDTGIANADLAVGEIVARLKERGLWEQTLLIVTSDHGEFFGEHGLVEHSKDVYEEVLHVPLVVKWPGETSAVRVAEDLISIADVPALVMESMPEDFDAEQRGLFKRSSLPDLSLAENNFSRSKDLRSAYGQRFMRERRVLYSGKHKLILSSDGGNELYDLDADPGEATNLFEQRPKVAKRLSMALKQYVTANPGEIDRAQPVQLDSQALQDLKALGYTGEDEEDDSEDSPEIQQAETSEGDSESGETE